jgi:hypothetical protein
MDALDAIGALEYAAGFEIMRNAIREELERGVSVPELAVRVGIGEQALRRFLAGGKPSLYVWHALTDFTQDRAPGLPHPGRLGLAVVVDSIRPKRRQGARKAVAEALANYLRAAGETVPGWLREELSAG